MYQWRTGLGDDTATDTMLVQSAAGILTPVIGAAATSAAAASAAAGGTGLILGMLPALAVPIIGAAIAAVAIAVTLFIRNSGCGVTCVETSQWANQASQLLDKNIATYFAQPIPRSQSAQAAALETFDTVWAQLQQLCGQPGTGTAGQNCISDRQAGACKWKALAPAYPGEPATGSCWNWFNAYRDPIANDPNVASDVTALAANPVSTGGELLSSATGSNPLLELALVGAAALVLFNL